MVTDNFSQVKKKKTEDILIAIFPTQIFKLNVMCILSGSPYFTILVDKKACMGTLSGDTKGRCTEEKQPAIKLFLARFLRILSNDFSLLKK